MTYPAAHKLERGVVEVCGRQSDWVELTSANLNLGAYSLRVRPLPRFLKHPLRKVSGLAKQIVNILYGI